MSTGPTVRRPDKVMPEWGIRKLLEGGYCGRIATVGDDGRPYICPLLYVFTDGEIWVHNTRARGHLRTNVDHEPRVCFEVDEAGAVFPYGRYKCDTSIEYRSVVVFGRIRIVEDREQKTAFFDAFMKKYAGGEDERTKGFYPRLDQVTVYAIAIEWVTGKETVLPAVEEQWPAVDRTKSPEVAPE
jgi:nitroimidazol reductase NimA-like FMN-containing flavoprotein (pyridoxamine 5'-phosphate oxidase superfamily)